jgi:DNA polymerase III delta prime subunit
MAVNKHNYKILLVAQSGSGKTMSAQNLDRDKTGFINTENKPLPFKTDFKYHVVPKTITEVTNTLVEFAKNSEINSIFIDSLSAIFDMVLMDCRKRFKGFEVWGNYNETIQSLIDLIKRVPKEMFITAHYESLGIEGSLEKRVKVKGKFLAPLHSNMY